MPARTLPTFTPAEIKQHTSEQSCFVLRGSRVYDVTSFIGDHPGGADLILDYAGKDVEEVMGDIVSHHHSDAAYEILDDCLVGFFEKPVNGSAKAAQNGSTTPAVYQSTGLSSAEDLNVETDITSDYNTHKFLDLSKPLLMQLWNAGFSKKFYLEQVHRPRHYRGGDSAPLFGNFLEPLSKTAWWVVPAIWVPCVLYGVVVGMSGMENIATGALYYLGGLSLWSLIEYGMHRSLFHVDDYLPDNRVAICLHFLLHGIHHYLPMDKYRLVMPPVLFIALATPYWKLAHIVFSYNWYAATLVFCGGVSGYICYDLTHYFLHHRNLPYYYKELKKYHLQHHFADYENGFGVTSRFWDKVFGTELPPLGPAKVE